MPSPDGEYVRRWFPPEFEAQESNARPAAARVDALAVFGVLLLAALVLVITLAY